ncbi:MAG: LCP family glycopolymer transferase [Desulfotomaculales bacterium]
MSRRYRLKNGWRLTAFLTVVVLLLSAGYLLARDIVLFLSSPADDAGMQAAVARSGRLNVLLLGIDARRGETKARSDSIILASFDPGRHRAALLSIPRDTRVRIPGHGWDKINAATIYGGPDMARAVVSDLLGIPVGYHVLTNFAGFKEIVDILGGVTIDVEEDMNYYDPADGQVINLRKGVQHLNGEKALQYVRYRGDPLGDITRTQRQQKFLVALAREMLQPGTILKLPRLIPQLRENVDTNLGLSEMLALVRLAQDLENVDLVTQTLPGYFLNLDGVSYWYVDPAQARQVVAELLAGRSAPAVLGEVYGGQVKTGTSAHRQVGEGIQMRQPAAPATRTRGAEDSGPAGSRPDGGRAGQARTPAPGSGWKPGTGVGSAPSGGSARSGSSTKPNGGTGSGSPAGTRPVNGPAVTPGGGTVPRSDIPVPGEGAIPPAGSSGTSAGAS